MCRHVCTVATQTKSETDTPNGKCQLAWLILKGRGAFTESVIQSMYKCATCNLCKSWCLTGIDIAKVVEAARADIVTLNKTPKSVVEIGENVERAHNVYGESHEKRFANIINEMPLSKNKAETVYFAGCTVAYRQPEIARAVIKTLRSANVSFTIMNGDEWCCGLPLYQLGLRDAAKKLAEHNAQAIKKIGCKTIVVSCPGCYEAFRTYYPSWNVELGAKVLHVSEYVESLLERGDLSLTKKISKVVTYHDPCHLGRHSNIYDPPRRTLKHIPGIKFIEMRWNRDKANCCGSGGGLPFVYPALTDSIARKRVNEAIETEAEVLSTACPACKHVFSCAVGKTESIKVYDIAELIAQAL